MTEEELKQAILLGREQRGVEFKGPGPLTDKSFLAKIIRAIIGMANKTDGGIVVVGVNDNGVRLDAVGLSNDEVETWTFDDLASNVSNYADPYVDFGLERVEMEGKQFIVIEVKQFDELPVICKRDSGSCLRKGALYVRRLGGRIETVEVPSHNEMRELTDRAAEFVARKMVDSHLRLCPHERSQQSVSQNYQTSKTKFDDEAKDLL